MKKALSFVLTAVMCAGLLAGCGSQTTGNSASLCCTGGNRGGRDGQKQRLKPVRMRRPTSPLPPEARLPSSWAEPLR